MMRCSLVFLAVFITLTPEASLAQTPGYSRWEDAIAAFEAGDREAFPDPGGILFVGSSSIRMWKTLESDMAPLPVINRGFGGSQIDDVVHFADRIVLPYKPSIILLYAGDNDVAAGKSPETVLADFKRFTAAAAEKLPQTRVFFLSIKPSGRRWSMWDTMREANDLVRAYTESKERLGYIDVSTPMLETDGTLKSDLFIEDGLHLNGDGYRLWTSIVKPLLLDIYRKPASK